MMKLINKIVIAAFAISISACFVACDDKDNAEMAAEIVSYSEIKELDINLLESQESALGYFTFEATGKWSVSSNKMWVTFSTEVDGDYMYDIQGAAGNKTVYVKVSNETRGFAESTAVVLISASDVEHKVAEIARPAKSHEFAVQTSEGVVLDKMSIDASASLLVDINANFDCGIIDYPDWLVEPVLEGNSYRFNVVEECVPMEQQGVVVFANSDHSEKYDMNINYVGMSPEVIEITGDSPWGWIVSLDGQEFKKDKSSLSDASEDVVLYGSLSMNVVCRDYSCDFVFAEVYSETLSKKEGDAAWIKAVRAENDPKSVTVTVDEFEDKSSRAGYLFAVPSALAACFNEALSAGKDTLVYRSSENVEDSISIYNYVLADVTQKDEGFKVVRVDDVEEVEIPCESDNSADYYVKLSNEYTISDVMACDVELGQSYIINTKLTSDDWSESYAFHDINGEEIRAKLWKLKINEGEDGYYRISITVPKSLDEELDNNIVLRLCTPENVNIKALVMRVQE